MILLPVLNGMRRLAAKFKKTVLTSDNANGIAMTTELNVAAASTHDGASDSAADQNFKRDAADFSQGHALQQEHQAVLSVIDRATQETMFHQNKAGLATKFRSRGKSSQARTFSPHGLLQSNSRKLRPLAVHLACLHVRYC